RNYENSMTVSMRDCLRFYLRNREKGVGGKNLVMGLIADQNPPWRPDSHWFRFLNQDTIFFDGGEKLALRCHLPVYFVKMERLQRGRYRMSFERIYDGEEEVAPNEITGRYVSRLEEMIRERPELWMWSHRRWKHKRPDAEC
ncbi:MAG: lysophospholipid acyltransferase family protein, partial [Alistipes sp.]|nr:lysophospholipid acyltransferase family protein [Alistipes sp.]